jgi:hypothetical protein
MESMEKRWIAINRIQKTLLALILLLMISAQHIPAVVITPDIHFIIGNETYQVNNTMNFHTITIDNSYIIFNTTGFYLTSSNDITITISYLNDNISSAGNQEKILDFTASTTGGEVTFNINGFSSGTNYIVKQTGIQIANPQANNTGYISFTNDQWSTHTYKIYQDGAQSSDTQPPTIQNLNRISSYPLDTSTQYGWENFTCTVTDDTTVSQVKLRLISSQISQNVTMTQIISTTTYYYNTTLTDHGNYTYSIWAKDTATNTATSSQSLFSKPPNWDINNDGDANLLDLNLLGLYYGNEDSPGWRREDIDNNGKIEILDFTLFGNNYETTWWE